MKSLLMVLFLMGGIAISTVGAQSCKPSAPECAATCKSATSADAVSYTHLHNLQEWSTKP